MVPTRRQLLTAVAAGSLPLSGCTGGGSAGNDGGESSAETSQMGGATTVRIEGSSFEPLKAAVETGATVEWVNGDGYQHDVTAAQFHDVAVEWDISETLSSGERATFTFEDSGVYEYYCTIHGKSTMCGAILVGGATLDRLLPCQSGTETTQSGGGGSGGESGSGGAY